MHSTTLVLSFLGPMFPYNCQNFAESSVALEFIPTSTASSQLLDMQAINVHLSESGTSQPTMLENCLETQSSSD